jgi:hypothetical protein
MAASPSSIRSSSTASCLASSVIDPTSRSRRDPAAGTSPARKSIAAVVPASSS